MMPSPLSRLGSEPFTFSQAEQAGINRSRLTELVSERQVRRVLQGVYLRADVPDTINTRAHAALLVIQPFGILCDRTAAWIHGVDTFEHRELEILPPLEVFVLRDRTRVRRHHCCGGERDLGPDDVMSVDSVRLTTPLRTALDLGCKLSRREAIAAMDGFARHCAVTPVTLAAALPRYRRRRGVIQLRQLVPLVDPRAESPGESMTRLTIIDEGLPVPELQYWVRRHDGDAYRLDLAYPLHRVAVEYDGVEFHSSPARRAADERRRAWLREHGWTIIVVTKDDFTREAIARWTRGLREALGLS
jgi:hypothetical protein